MPPTRAAESMNARPRRSLGAVSTPSSNSAPMGPPSLPPSRTHPSSSSAPLLPPDHAKPPADRRASLRREAKTSSSPVPSQSSSAKPDPPFSNRTQEVRKTRASLSKAAQHSPAVSTPKKTSNAMRLKGAGKPKGGGMMLGARSPEVKAAVARVRKQQWQAASLALAKTMQEDAEVDDALGGDVFWNGGGPPEAGAAAPIPKKKVKPGGEVKEYMAAGFYCQDANADSPNKLVSRILRRREMDAKKNGRRKSGRGKVGESLIPPVPSDQAQSFPPLPYDHGYRLFFEEEHEFVLPWNIKYEADSGKLDGKKKPMTYSKVRSNSYPERQKYSSEYVAICKCEPASGCGDNCINRIMNYLCGKDCPCGEACTNKSLAKRRGANVKVVYTGNRGFGLMAMADINEGDFVIDYRGEVISLNTFLDRCKSDYSKSKNFYALAYDADEVIDAGNRGNEARFINHGCDPNLEVRKYQTLGDGQEEFEVGMWAIKDIKAGQELYYDYNFDSFAVRTSNDQQRTPCHCGAANCVGFLGRKAGEKSARVLAQELEAKARANAAKSSKKAKRAMKSALSRASVKKTATKTVKSPKFQPQIKAKDVAKAKARTAVGSAKRRQEAEVAKSQQRSAALLATMAEIASTPLHPKRTRQSNGAPAEVLSTPVATPSSSSRKRGRAAATETPLTSLSSRRSSGDGESPDDDDTPNSKKSRNSGWADWLRKKAAEMPRTREQWEHFALQRRRGKVWMEGMMAEFGVAPYEGAPAEPYTPSISLPTPGQPQRRGPPPGTPRPPRQSQSATKEGTASKRRSTSAGSQTGSRQNSVHPPPDIQDGDRSARSSMGAPSPHGFIAHQLNGAGPSNILPPITTPSASEAYYQLPPAPYSLPPLATHLGGPIPTPPAYPGPSRGRRSNGASNYDQPYSNGFNQLPTAFPVANGSAPSTGRATRRTRASLPSAL